MPTSKSIRQLEERMANLQPGTIRYETLEAAKRFKSSWIELGRTLWTVWSQKKFREWEYLTFEAYCTKEIGIKAATAKKLLHSYYFLEKEEPTALKRILEDSPTRLPSLDAVNALRLLSRRQGLPPQNYQQVRTQVLEKAHEGPQVRQTIREILEAVHPDPAAARAARRTASLRRMIGTLQSIRLELAAAKWVPPPLLSEIETLVKKLEKELER